MFDFFNFVLYSSLLMASPTLVARNYLDDVPKPPLGGVEQIVFRDPKFWSDPECFYSGIVTPYVRDWEETRDNGFSQEVVPPEPDKIAGYALVFNKKECKDKPAEHILYVASWAARGRLDKGGKIQAAAVYKDNRPNWLPQVIKTIEKAAATDKAAKEFLDFSAKAAADAKAANAAQ